MVFRPLKMIRCQKENWRNPKRCICFSNFSPILVHSFLVFSGYCFSCYRYVAGVDAISRLQRFHINSNLLAGKLPDAMASMANLRLLILGNNRLSCKIPDAMVSMRSLSEVCMKLRRIVRWITPSKSRSRTPSRDLRIKEENHRVLEGAPPGRATTLLHFSRCSRPFIQSFKSTLSHLKSCNPVGGTPSSTA